MAGVLNAALGATSAPLRLPPTVTALFAALAVAAILQPDERTRAVVAELAAELVAADSGRAIYVAAYNAALFASCVLEGWTR